MNTVLFWENSIFCYKCDDTENFKTVSLKHLICYWEKTNIVWIEKNLFIAQGEIQVFLKKIISWNYDLSKYRWIYQNENYLRWFRKLFSTLPKTRRFNLNFSLIEFPKSSKFCLFISGNVGFFIWINLFRIENCLSSAPVNKQHNKQTK